MRSEKQKKSINLFDSVVICNNIKKGEVSEMLRSSQFIIVIAKVAKSPCALIANRKIIHSKCHKARARQNKLQ